MRTAFLLAAFALAFALPLAGCDSVGLDDVPCATCGGHSGGDKDSDDGTGSDDGGSDDAGGDDGSTGGTDAGSDDGTDGDDGKGDGSDDKGKEFLQVDPRQTYLRTEGDDALDAPALRLADWGLEAGDDVCATVVGDFYTEPGVLASSRGLPLVTAIFSADDDLLASTERARVKAALEAGDDVATWATAVKGLETDVPEDLDASDVCVTIPKGAAYVFLATFDSYYGDNADAQKSGQPFGLLISY